MKRFTTFIRPVLEALEDRCIPASGMDPNSIFGAFAAVEHSAALGSMLVENALPILSNPQLRTLAQGLLTQDAQALVQAAQDLTISAQQTSSSDPASMYYSIMNSFIEICEGDDEFLEPVGKAATYMFWRGVGP